MLKKIKITILTNQMQVSGHMTMKTFHTVSEKDMLAYFTLFTKSESPILMNMQIVRIMDFGILLIAINILNFQHILKQF